MGEQMKKPTLVRRCFILLLLLGIVASSVLCLTSYKGGWAYLCKKGLRTETSPYINMMRYLYLRYPDPDFNIELAETIEFQLPPAEDTSFDMKTWLGWLKSESEVTITGGGPVAPHLHIMAEIMIPARHIDNVNGLLKTGQSSLVEEYDGDRLAAKYIGIIIAGIIIANALHALMLCSLVLFSRGDFPFFLKQSMGRAWTIGFAMFSLVCLEYVVLAIGSYRETKNNPILSDSYIAYPDWAWFIALVPAVCWLCLWFIGGRDKGGLERVPSVAPGSDTSSAGDWKLSAAQNVREGGLGDSAKELP